MFINRGMKKFYMADAGAGTGGDAGGDAKPWFDTFDADTKGYITNKGLDRKTAAEAFLEAAKFHREAEKFVGAPANEMVRLPKEANAPEWETVHQRLGKPKDKAEYDFAAVKHVGDKPLDAALADTLRAAAFNSNLPKEAAVRMATDIVKHMDGVAEAADAIKADKLAVEKAELMKNWGGNAAANRVVAEAAAKALGVSPEAVAALEGVVGYAKIMEMFRTIGTKIGEDRFVTSGGAGGGIMTRDQAVAEKAELMRDRAWTTRYSAGGVEEMRKMTALNKIIVGVA